MAYSFKTFSYEARSSEILNSALQPGQDSSRLIGYPSVNLNGNSLLQSGFSNPSAQSLSTLNAPGSSSFSASNSENSNRILSLYNFNSDSNNQNQSSTTYQVNISSLKENVYMSEIEQSILRSQVPISLNETDEITVLGQRGIWANRQEVANWRGVLPLTEYQINEDKNPEIITKRTQQSLEYIQELAVRYLRPPTPPAPGEIIINQQSNILTPPAPPVVIRQQPARPNTPEPLVVREAPPQPPAQIGRKVITISGKRLPPPPRKVIIERLAPLPSKPQSVIVERWLPYAQVKRRVIFQKSSEVDAVVVKPRNVIVQWEAPQIQIKKELKYLGIIRANPVEYVQRYGSTLKTSHELPDFILDIKPPQGLVLAADYQYNQVHELEGELQAFRLVDLEREGLVQYKSQLDRLGIRFSSEHSFQQHSSFGYSSSSSLNSNENAPIIAIIADIFSQVDRDQNGKLSVEEAEKLLLKLNSRLGRRYGEDDVKSFFKSLDSNKDGFISLVEFRKAFERHL